MKAHNVCSPLGEYAWKVTGKHIDELEFHAQLVWLQILSKIANIALVLYVFLNAYIEAS